MVTGEQSLFDVIPDDDDGPCPHCGGSGRLSSTRAVAARTRDRTTSQRAAAGALDREGQTLDVNHDTHRHRMLWAYIDGDALTDHEAATVAGLDRPGVCWWKRASELRQGGWIQDTGRVATDPASGAARIMCEITPAGLGRAHHLGRPTPRP